MRVVVVADPLDGLDPAVDTTLALMTAAQRRGHRVQHCQPHELAVVDGLPRARLHDDRADKGTWTDLADADAVLLRTDPPMDRAYLDATYILDLVDTATTTLVNDPRGVRLADEKLWALAHPDLCPPTLVSTDADLIADFVARHRRCVVKPTGGHAGRGVLVLAEDDPNRTSIVELLTGHGRRQVIAQPWLDAVHDGNKRIFLHFGRPAAAVLRYPGAGDFRIGDPAKVTELSARDREICDRLGPELAALGLPLVGLDVIGDDLIEVNVTSSGALHKADRVLGTTLCDDFIHQLETTRRTP